MATLPGFMPYAAERLRLTRRKMVASQEIYPGDALKQTATAATLEVAASNDALFYAVFMDTPRLSTDSDYASTPYRTVMLISPDVQWYGVRESGTLTEADVNTDVDLASADGLAIDTSTNDDFHIDLYIDANTCVGRFNNGMPKTV